MNKHQPLFQSIARPFVILTLLMMAQTSVYAGGMDLVSSLTDKLGVSSEQATGGAGAIFGYAKDNLDADDFASIAEGIPGMDGLLSDIQTRINKYKAAQQAQPISENVNEDS